MHFFILFAYYSVIIQASVNLKTVFRAVLVIHRIAEAFVKSTFAKYY